MRQNAAARASRRHRRHPSHPQRVANHPGAVELPASHARRPGPLRAPGPNRHRLPGLSSAPSLRGGSIAVCRSCLPGHTGPPQHQPGYGYGVMTAQNRTFSKGAMSGDLNLPAAPAAWRNASPARVTPFSENHRRRAGIEALCRPRFGTHRTTRSGRPTSVARSPELRLRNRPAGRWR